MENPTHEAQAKSSKIPFFRRLFTWRIARRMLVGLAAFATLIAVFYTVENWRGKRAWENYKREAEAGGAVLDWNLFIPPSVPDEQNFFKAPKMQEWFVGRGMKELSKRLDISAFKDFSLGRDSKVDGWILGEILVGPNRPANVDALIQFEDPAAAQQIEELIQNVTGPSTKSPQELVFLADRTSTIKPLRIFVRSDQSLTLKEMEKLIPDHVRFEAVSGNSFRLLLKPSVYFAADYLAWSGPFESDFNLIREALKRPFGRMEGDYGEPFNIPIPNFINVRSVSQTLTLRAQCFLLLGQPEKALEELTMIHNLCRILEARPTGRPMTLVAAMINVAVTGLYVNTIADGMRLKAWNEPQLAVLEAQLQEINLLPFVEGGFICERTGLCHTLETTAPRKIMGFVEIIAGPSSSSTLWQKIMDSRFYLYNLAPRGWIYQNMVSHAKLMDKTIDVIDLDNQIISPRKQAEAGMAIEKVTSNLSPYTFVTSISVPNTSRATERLGLNQTRANQALIVCGLERYRLAYGNYPESLDALVPQFADKIPHDIIGGEPLKYRRADDGEFLLYSIGWNEKDDGGTTVETKMGGVSVEGDWVWKYPEN